MFCGKVAQEVYESETFMLMDLGSGKSSYIDLIESSKLVVHR
jgi:hypothetical protein